MSNYSQQLGKQAAFDLGHVNRVPKGIGGSYMQNMGEGARGVHDAIGSGISGAAHGIGHGIGSAAHGIGSWWDDLKGGLGSIGDWFKDTTKSIGHEWNDIKRGWGIGLHNAGTGLSSAASSIGHNVNRLGNSIADSTYRPIANQFSQGYNQASTPNSAPPRPRPQMNMALIGQRNRETQQMAQQTPPVQAQTMQYPNVHGSGLYGQLNPYNEGQYQ